MNTADIAILICIVLLAGFAVYLTVRRRRKGSSCCGNCSGCSMCCDGKKDQTEE